MDQTPLPPTTRRFALIVPTGRLVVLSALLAIPVGFADFVWPDHRLVLALVCLGIMLALLVIDGVLAPGISSLSGSRTVDTPIVLGQPSTVSWTITNHATRQATLWLSDGASPSLRPDTGRLTIKLAPNAVAVSTYQIRPVRRGMITIDGPVIRSFGPLGLAAAQWVWALDAQVLVNPAFPSRKLAELRLTDARRLFAGQRAVRIVGESSEFDYLRDYTPDDDIRHINWAASARSQHLVVEQTRAERNHQVIVLLDHSRLSAPTVRRFTPPPTVFDGPVVDLDVIEQETFELDRAPRLDHNIDAALALGHVTTGLGDRFGLITYAGTVTNILPPDNTLSQRVALGRILAAVHPNWDEADPLAAATWLMANWQRPALVVVLTDLAAEHARTRLRSAITRLSRRHHIVIGAAGDPTVDMWAQTKPIDELGAMRMLAARRAIQRRQSTAAMLTRMGVDVIDAPAGQLSDRLLDTYLGASNMSAESRVNVAVQRGWSSDLRHDGS
ncbi:DUF58 domain-containing protein [Stomatohabitans albus]|uniref:DUF58 domain-containing protein n=1 Tax=Stomatohabitans albus TaxID=3110766 RepID=UPI00300D3FF2